PRSSRPRTTSPAASGDAGRIPPRPGRPAPDPATMSTQPHDPIVRSYDGERPRLSGHPLRMARQAAPRPGAALDAADRRDAAAAARIVANDEAIDALEAEVSHDVMKLALRGPLARDLRGILAALRIAADIERIGDYAANMAKRSTALNTAPPL